MAVFQCECLSHMAIFHVSIYATWFMVSANITWLSFMVSVYIICQLSPLEISPQKKTPPSLGGECLASLVVSSWVLTSCQQVIWNKIWIHPNWRRRRRQTKKMPSSTALTVHSCTWHESTLHQVPVTETRRLNESCINSTHNCSPSVPLCCATSPLPHSSASVPLPVLLFYGRALPELSKGQPSA